MRDFFISNDLKTQNSIDLILWSIVIFILVLFLIVQNEKKWNIPKFIWLPLTTAGTIAIVSFFLALFFVPYDYNVLIIFCLEGLLLYGIHENFVVKLWLIKKYYYIKKILKK